MGPLQPTPQHTRPTPLYQASSSKQETGAWRMEGRKKKTKTEGYMVNQILKVRTHPTKSEPHYHSVVFKY